MFISIVTTEPYALEGFKANSHVNPLPRPQPGVVVNDGQWRPRKGQEPTVARASYQDIVPARRSGQIGAGPPASTWEQN